MYLLIFESIGTSELLLIGLVALIIFGPRKLPEMMKTFGKAMAEFKRSTNEFKESWEKEVDFENLAKETSEDKKLLENSIERESFKLENEIVAPEIKEVNTDDFEKIAINNKVEDSEIQEIENVSELNNESNDLSQKRDWL